jgi:uncharacterized membrane protein (UPF0136 family)
MIGFIKNTELDKWKWDHLVAADVNGHSFLYTSYLDLVSDSWGIICDTDVSAGIVVFEKILFGKRIVILPNFTQAIPFIGDVQFKNALEEYLTDYLAQSSLVSYAYTGLLKKHSGLNVQQVNHQLIRYNNGQRFPTKVWGRNIRKAEAGNYIECVHMPTRLFVSSLKLEMKQKGNPYSVKDYQRLTTIIDQSIKLGIGFLKGIQNKNGTFVCGQYYVYHNNQLYLVACFSDSEAKQSSVLHYLMYQLIRDFFSDQLVVHFGGSAIPVIADFNKNFGATDESYIKISKRNVLLSLLNKIL